MAESTNTTPPDLADPAQDHQDALDEISCAFAQIKSGLGLLRDEAHSINNNRELEERLIFLVDAMERRAKDGSAAFDRAEWTLVHAVSPAQDASPSPAEPEGAPMSCMASKAVLTRLHQIMSLAGLAGDVADGLAGMLEGAIEDTEGADTTTNRALVRLARSLAEDVNSVHTSMDGLLADTLRAGNAAEATDAPMIAVSAGYRDAYARYNAGEGLGEAGPLWGQMEAAEAALAAWQPRSFAGAVEAARMVEALTPKGDPGEWPAKLAAAVLHLAPLPAKGRGRAL